jgi:hypothetical protein
MGTRFFRSRQVRARESLDRFFEQRRIGSSDRSRHSSLTRSPSRSEMQEGFRGPSGCAVVGISQNIVDGDSIDRPPERLVCVVEVHSRDVKLSSDSGRITGRHVLPS